MAGSNEPDGKNSLLGEFLVALARAPAPVQEAIIMQGMKQFLPFARDLIHPYPMLSHVCSLMLKGGMTKGGGSGEQ